MFGIGVVTPLQIEANLAGSVIHDEKTERQGTICSN